MHAELGGAKNKNHILNLHLALLCSCRILQISAANSWTSSHTVHIPHLASASVNIHLTGLLMALFQTWDHVQQPPKPLLGSCLLHEEPTHESWFWALVHRSQTHCLRKGQVHRSPTSAQWCVIVSTQTPQPDIFCLFLFSETYCSCLPVVAYMNCSLWKCSCLMDPYIEYTVQDCTVTNGSDMVLKMSQIW